MSNKNIKNLLYFINYSLYYILLIIFEKITYSLTKIFRNLNKDIDEKRLDIQLKILTGDY